MKHTPIFDSSKFKTPSHYSQGSEAYSYDMHYVTPPRNFTPSLYQYASTGKPPLNSKFLPLETTVPKNNYKYPQTFHHYEFNQSYEHKTDNFSQFYEKKIEKNNSSFERKPIFDQNKTHVTFATQLNTPGNHATYTRKLSAGTGTGTNKTESIFTTNCPDCHRFINLLDGKSSKNQPLEEYLKEIMNLIPVKKDSSESFLSNNALFEGKDAHIEQKYGKYLKNSLSKNSIFESPIASRNILFSNKKMSTTMNSFDYYCGKSRQDDSFMSVDRKKEDKLNENEQESKTDGREKMENNEKLNETIGDLMGELKFKDEQIKRLNEMNRKLMEDMNALMKIRLL